MSFTIRNDWEPPRVGRNESGIYPRLNTITSPILPIADFDKGEPSGDGRLYKTRRGWRLFLVDVVDYIPLGSLPALSEMPGICRGYLELACSVGEYVTRISPKKKFGSFAVCRLVRAGSPRPEWEGLIAAHDKACINDELPLG